MNSKLIRLAVFAAAAGAASAVQAVTIPLDTTSTGAMDTFKNGATVETFDNISGVTPVVAANYNTTDVSGSPAALFNKDPNQSAFYNSGGANPQNIQNQPGVPIAAVTAPDKLSGNSVGAPLNVVAPPFTLFQSGSFIEVFFPTPVSKVGFYVAHGAAQLILKNTDPIPNNLDPAAENSITGSAGHFIGLTRPTADIGAVTILQSGNEVFTIDDFTYLVGTTTGGGGSTGGNGSSVPDNGATLSLILAGGLLWIMQRKLAAQAS